MSIRPGTVPKPGEEHWFGGTALAGISLECAGWMSKPRDFGAQPIIAGLRGLASGAG